MICFVVAGLFVADLARLGFARTMAVGFVSAMLLLVAGLLIFLVEVRVAYRAIRISDDLLERKLRPMNRRARDAPAPDRRRGRLPRAAEHRRRGDRARRGDAARRCRCRCRADVDSHFRYLCGIFFVVGLAFASCVPAIERKGARFRLLGAMVVAGGLSRLLSLALVGPPSFGHRFGLVMELGVVPLLMLWQARIARRR